MIIKNSFEALGEELWQMYSGLVTKQMLMASGQYPEDAFE
jgi:hypothetical protein